VTINSYLHHLDAHRQSQCNRIHFNYASLDHLGNNENRELFTEVSGLRALLDDEVVPMQVREYLPGDEQEVLALFAIVFGRQLDLKFWNWRMVENPFGSGIIRLMFDNGKLVGHYAVMPIRLWARGNTIKAALSMTTMTHPEYTGRGVFKELASEVYRCCEVEGIEVVFGFPNENSYYGFTHKLGWRGFGAVKGWVRQGGAQRPVQHEFECREVSTCDEIGCDLWSKVRETDRIMVPRTAEYLNWRYFGKPGNEYTVFVYNDRKGSARGLIVLKAFEGEDSTTGHIVDIVAPHQPEIQRALLAKAVDFFAELGITNISCWIPSNSSIASQLQAAGYSEKEWQTFFGVKMLDDAYNEASFVSDPNSWWFTMGDSDVF